MTQRSISQQPHVLYVVRSLAMGGVSTLLASLAELRERRPFAMSVCETAESGPVAQRVRDAGVAVHALRRKANWDIRAASDLAHIVRADGIDVIVTNSMRENIYGTFASWMTGKPVVMHRHGISLNQNPLILWLNGVAARRAAMVICISNATREAWLKEASLDRNRVTVIHNGVFDPWSPSGPTPDERQAARTSLGFPSTSCIIGTVGDLLPVKDPLTLVEAFAQARKVNDRVKLVIVGDGPLRPDLERRAHALGLSQDGTLLTGEVANARVLLPGFDIYVHSAAGEAFGIAVVEAMLAGCAVIVANAGGLPEIIRESETGLIVEPGRPEELANAICRLAADSSLRSQFGTRARADALSRFNMLEYASQLQQAYVAAVKARVEKKETSNG